MKFYYKSFFIIATLSFTVLSELKGQTVSTVFYDDFGQHAVVWIAITEKPEQIQSSNHNIEWTVMKILLTTHAIS